MPDPSTLVKIAGIVVAFGVAVIIFRVQRENQMAQRGEITWVAACDWLAIIATLVSLLFVILPLLANGPEPANAIFPAAASFSIVLMVGWIFSILAHYRLILSGGRSGSRENPEPSERILIILSLLLATAAFVFIFFRSR